MRMNTIIEELDRSSKTIAPEKLQEVIKKIKEHKRIFVYGTGRSGLMLKAFAMRLMQIGLNSYVVGETTTPSVQEGDLLIVASASGETGTWRTLYTATLVGVQRLGSLFEQMLLMVFDTIILEMSEEKEGSNEDMAKRHASLE